MFGPFVWCWHLTAVSQSLLALELSLLWVVGSAAKLWDPSMAFAEGDQWCKCHFQSWTAFAQTQGTESTFKNPNVYLRLRVEIKECDF